MPLFTPLLLIIGAYCLGSLSSAIVISEMMGLPDPRSGGSNNPGATNVLRLGGKKAAAMVLACDVLKGTIPVLIGHICMLDYPMLSLIGVAAVLGHIFPLFYEFKGGKGVATVLGMFFGLHWSFGLICTSIWLVSVKISQYSSLSSLIMVCCAPMIAMVYLNSWLSAVPLACLTLLIAFQHRENIQRLISHTESKTTLFKRG